MGLHNIFRRELAIKLMARNRAHLHIFTYSSVPGKRTVLATVLKPSGSHSGQLVKGTKQSACMACQAGAQYASKRRFDRPALGEISTNIASKPPRAPRTNYVCDQCNIALYRDGPCWQEHLDSYTTSSQN